ncbi:TetR/AcrR family transcriptional regulator [Mycolicibacterium elephantis]|uniref:TetR/AcrR family transcriptional regulator n=1 Tax=Mycolicibacterium elephantis TaxID=81858 RepID=UPI000A453E63|nr:TetR/AcrR family transcriptional regulator [Mycolicibacterium elephantis]
MAQRSNREQLIEGAVRCLERLPAEKLTARVIAAEAGANAASIAYHFGSKDELVTIAVIRGLDRWLSEVEEALSELSSTTPEKRFRDANAVIDRTRQRHAGLVQNFIAAVARAPHDPTVRDHLVAGFQNTRPAVARLLDLGDNSAGSDAAGLVLSLFYGLMLQVSLDPKLSITGRRFDHACRRLSQLLQDAAG